MLSIKEMLNLPKEEQEALIKETNETFFQNFGIHPDAVSVKDYVKDSVDMPPEPPAIIQNVEQTNQAPKIVGREPEPPIEPAIIDLTILKSI